MGLALPSRKRELLRIAPTTSHPRVDRTMPLVNKENGSSGIDYALLARQLGPVLDWVSGSELTKIAPYPAAKSCINDPIWQAVLPHSPPCQSHYRTKAPLPHPMRSVSFSRGIQLGTTFLLSASWTKAAKEGLREPCLSMLSTVRIRMVESKYVTIERREGGGETQRRN